MSATQKTALVTGANKGIGKEIVRQLATKGYKVFLGARDETRGKEAVAELLAAGLKDIHFLSIDVTSDESVKKAAASLATQISALDVLVNNAGLLAGGEKKPFEESLEDWKATFDVNVFGVVRTTQAFVELVKKSKAGRIVNLGSGLGSLGITTDKTHPFYNVVYLSYNASKSALNAVTVGFAKTLAEFNIKVNTADPGYTATDMNGHKGFQTLEEGAESTLFLATLPEDGPTGAFYDRHGVVAW